LRAISLPQLKRTTGHQNQVDCVIGAFSKQFVLPTTAKLRLRNP
jgi:hypothetical protein